MRVRSSEGGWGVVTPPPPPFPSNAFGLSWYILGAVASIPTETEIYQPVSVGMSRFSFTPSSYAW